MSNWTDGYVTDIGYTFGYYTELNPLRVKLAFLNAGLKFPNVVTACELGFGQGVSTNIHASASVTRWHGTDFNAAQAGFAQEIATASENGAQLFDDAFSEFCTREAMPDFDYIGLHGIWSWISDDNRRTVVDFIRRKLKVGGVLYISYNTMPGWSVAAPLRHLLTEHANALSAPGQSRVGRIDASLEFADKLLKTEPAYARANPSVAERFEGIKAHNRNYLAHEYFNRDWHPMYFSNMAAWLEPAKLNFAESAAFLDYVPQLNLSTGQQEFLATIPDVIFRQTVLDFMTNRQFRKDYWVKGARTLSPTERTEGLREQRVVLVVDPADVAFKVKGHAGEAQLNEAIYRPLVALMADFKPRSLGQIEQAMKSKVVSPAITLAQVSQAVLVLAGLGKMEPVQDDKTVAQARKHTDRLNQILLKKGRDGVEIPHLASPVTGGGVPVARFQQLFLLALSQGHKQPQDWANFAWNVLKAQGQKLLKEGKPLDTEEENIAELLATAQVFLQKHLPILKALQIV